MQTRAGRPPRISKTDIIAAAHRVIDAEGTPALTMRRLAREVGATPMALYHHVRDKDELLLLLLDDYAAGVPRPEPPAGATPAERIVAASVAMYEALRGVPWLVDVLASDDLMSVHALWYPEEVIDAAAEAGLSAEEAVDAYRIIWHYTVGDITVRAGAARRREDDRPTHRGRVFEHLDAARLPRLAAFGTRWEEVTVRDTYARGVEALVRGLLAP
jgi:AcrR family transcriptional regulator